MAMPKPVTATPMFPKKAQQESTTTSTKLTMVTVEARVAVEGRVARSEGMLHDLKCYFSVTD